MDEVNDEPSAALPSVDRGRVVAALAGERIVGASRRSLLRLKLRPLRRKTCRPAAASVTCCGMRSRGACAKRRTTRKNVRRASTSARASSLREEFPKDGKKRTLVDTQLKREAEVWAPDTKPDEWPFYEATGKYALGINLDGKVTPEDFESDDGRKGIDNQLFRVVGCVRNYRQEGELGIITTKWRAQKPFNRVTFELSGVESLKNDPDVTVTYYRTLDTLLAGPTGNYLPGGSQRVDARWGKRFIAKAKGRIVNGVLETQPFDRLLVPEDGMGDPAINIFRSAQLRLTLTPEGAEGVLGGFIDVEQWYYAMNTRLGDTSRGLRAGVCGVYLQGPAQGGRWVSRS